MVAPLALNEPAKQAGRTRAAGAMRRGVRAPGTGLSGRVRATNVLEQGAPLGLYVPAAHAIERIRRRGRTQPAVREGQPPPIAPEPGGEKERHVRRHVVPDRALPGEQVQMGAPKLLVVPGGHGVHVVSPALLYVFGLHAGAHERERARKNARSRAGG